MPGTVEGGTMDRTTRSFILASLVYLAIGAVLGLILALAPQSLGRILFSHVHLLLGGFMAMMIYGVGYFILPRFAASAIRWPAMVPAHFWLANLSLLGMVISRPFAVTLDSAQWMGIFHLSVTVQVLSIFLFVANLGLTLSLKPKPAATSVAEPASAPSSPGSGSASLRMAGSSPVAGAVTLGPASKVGDFVDAKTGAVELPVDAGLPPLRDPEHLAMVRRVGIPLAHACNKHGIDLETLLPRLMALPDARPTAALTSEQLIGEMVERHPATREVLRRRFGEGCFTCPGFATETLAQGAMMHGVDVQELIAELEQAIRGG
jgi:hybrid cluster-associated redox disulfide protein